MAKRVVKGKRLPEERQRTEEQKAATERLLHEALIGPRIAARLAERVKSEVTHIKPVKAWRVELKCGHSGLVYEEPKIGMMRGCRACKMVRRFGK